MARIIGEDVQSDKIQLLTGVNLAMILQMLAVRESGEVSVEDLVNAGKDGVVYFNDILTFNRTSVFNLNS